MKLNIRKHRNLLLSILLICSATGIVVAVRFYLEPVHSTLKVSLILASALLGVAGFIGGLNDAYDLINELFRQGSPQPAEQGERPSHSEKSLRSVKEIVSVVLNYGVEIRVKIEEIRVGGSAIVLIIVLVLLFVMVLFVLREGEIREAGRPVPTAIQVSSPQLFAPASPGETLIILCPYSGRLRNAEVFPERFVRDALKGKVEELNLSGYRVRLEQCPRPVASARDARKIGTEYKATLVVWGEFDDIGGVRTSIEILHDVPIPETEQSGEWLSFVSLPQNQHSNSTSAAARESFTKCAPEQAEYLALISLGIIALTKSNYPDAERFFTDAIHTVSVSTSSRCHISAYRAYYWHGVVRSLQESYAEAMADFNRAISLDSGQPEIYVQRGIARFVLGNVTGALDDMRKAIEIVDADDLHGRAIISSDIGLLLGFQGKTAKARRYYMEALELDVKAKDARGQAMDLGGLGNLAFWERDFDTAMSYYQQSLALYKETGDKRGEAGMVGNIGLINESMGKLELARHLYEQALHINRSINYLQGEAIDLEHLGSFYQRQHLLDKALEYHNRALTICQEIGFRMCQATVIGNIGMISYEQGDIGSADAFYQKALAIDREVGYRYGEAKQLLNIGLAQQKTGNFCKARQSYSQALSIYQQIGWLDGQARSYLGLGMVESKQGNKQEALADLKRSLALFEALGLPEAKMVRGAIQQIEP